MTSSGAVCCRRGGTGDRLVRDITEVREREAALRQFIVEIKESDPCLHRDVMTDRRDDLLHLVERQKMAVRHCGVRERVPTSNHLDLFAGSVRCCNNARHLGCAGRLVRTLGMALLVTSPVFCWNTHTTIVGRVPNISQMRSPGPSAHRSPHPCRNGNQITAPERNNDLSFEGLRSIQRRSTRVRRRWWCNGPTAGACRAGSVVRRRSAMNQRRSSRR